MKYVHFRLEEARRALGGMGGAALAVEQRIELARQQQAAREARKDAVKGREQVIIYKEVAFVSCFAIVFPVVSFVRKAFITLSDCPYKLFF